ncbi:hypothetical protein [Leptospira wolffii]|uniref:hypothetical protein n=1 Tax=Leptospira wolffii TaxID=409998 RepID=UPI000311B9E8|nr:hypothetical protein [Leptospira wolffii]EPG64891.1 hypothetical protein LEP1GSC061_3037 [Leptospira wolffii serovar Khorat str. Khorat-H2]
MEDKNREKLDQEIFRRLESYDWSNSISEKVIRTRRISLVRRFLTISFGGALIGFLGVSSFWVQPQGESESGDWQVWVEEQIEGTFEDAETSMQTPELTQDESTAELPTHSNLMDVDSLIETSFERRQ